MSQNSCEAPPTRVVSILKNLGSDATALREQTRQLQETRSLWAPAQVGGRTTLMPGAQTLPAKCADKLEQAAGYEQQFDHFVRRERTGEREAQRAREERQSLENRSNETIQEAEQRRIDAERRLEELRCERQQAETRHRAKLATEDTNTEVELGRIECTIEKTWKEAAAYTNQARQDTAAERARCEREVEEANADFNRQAAAYEQSLAEYDDACEAGVAAAQERVRQSEISVNKAWADCEVTSRTTHIEADGRVEEHIRIRDGTIEETNKILSEEETQLAAELAEVNGREQAARTDRTPEQRVEAFRASVSADNRKRKEACDSHVRDCLNTMARLTREAADAAARAANRAKCEQSRTDRQVEATVQDIEKFAEIGHQGKLMEQRSALNAVIAEASRELLQRVRSFQELEAHQAREANEALVRADRKVEELRTWAGALRGEKNQVASDQINDIRSEREKALTDSNAKVLRTQEQMVQYVGSQFEEMLLSLQRNESSEEVQLRLDFSRAIATPSPELGVCV